MSVCSLNLYNGPTIGYSCRSDMKSEGPNNFLCPRLNPLRSSLSIRGTTGTADIITHPSDAICTKTRHIRGEYQLLTSAEWNEEMALWVRGEQKPEPRWLVIRRRWPGFHRQTRRCKNNQALSDEWSQRQTDTLTDGGQTNSF